MAVHKKIKVTNHFSRLQISIFVVLFALIGGYFIINSFAATNDLPSCTTTVSSAAAVQTALNAAPAGSTICLSDGTYGKLTLSATKTTPGVTIRAQNPGQTIINGASLSGTYLTLAQFKSTDEIITQNNSDHMTILHNFITGGYMGATTGPGTYNSQRVTNITVRGNRFVGPLGEDGIRANQYNNLVVEGNEFTNIRENGNHSDCLQTVWLGTNINFKYNYLHDNLCEGTLIKDHSEANTQYGDKGTLVGVNYYNNIFTRNDLNCGILPDGTWGWHDQDPVNYPPAVKNDKSCGQPGTMVLFGATDQIHYYQNTFWGGDITFNLDNAPLSNFELNNNAINRLSAGKNQNFSSINAHDNIFCGWETQQGASLPSALSSGTTNCNLYGGKTAPSVTNDDFRISGSNVGVTWKPSDCIYGPSPTLAANCPWETGGSGPISDTSAPTAPSGLTTWTPAQKSNPTRAGTSTPGSNSLRWVGSTDNTGSPGYVAKYKIYRNNTLIDYTTGLVYTDSMASPTTTYTYKIVATDAAGNDSPASSSVDVLNNAVTTPTGQTANIWIAPGGSSTCTRSTQPTLYVAGAGNVCNWQRGYNQAISGETVLVKGGSYTGTTSLRSNRNIPITFQPATNEIPQFDWFNGGDYQDPGVSKITLKGPMKAKRFSADGTTDVTVDGWTVDGQGADNVQIFHAETTTRFTARNSEIMNNKNNSLSYVSGTDLVFEYNSFHDAALPSEGPHTECMYATSTTNLTLRGNHFYRCAVMDVFITGNTGETHGTVESNIFETPYGLLPGSPGGGLAFHFRNNDRWSGAGAPMNVDNGDNITPDIGAWTFRNNTFVGPLSFGNNDPNVYHPNVLIGPIRMINNIFLNSAPCGISSNYATYSHNATKSGSCGSGGISNASLSTFFVSSSENPGPGDWHFKPTLISTNPLDNAGDPADFAPTDADNKARTDGSPDIGAYEYQSGTTPTCTKSGDINCDNAVNVTDLSILLSNYGKTTAQLASSLPSYPRADINSSGKVDIGDLSALLTGYGK